MLFNIWNLKYASPNFSMNELTEKTVTKQRMEHVQHMFSCRPKSVALDLGKELRESAKARRAKHVISHTYTTDSETGVKFQEEQNVRDYLIFHFTLEELNLLKIWTTR